MSFPIIDCVWNGLHQKFFVPLKRICFVLLLGAALWLLLSLIANYFGDRAKSPTRHPLELRGGLYELCLPSLPVSSLGHLSKRCFWSGVIFSPDTNECFSIIFWDDQPQITLISCQENE